jgi:hypothetical protein
VKLIDVYPDYPERQAPRDRGSDVPPPAIKMAGYQQLVRGEPLRGNSSHGFEKPMPFAPGKVIQ